MSVQSESSRLDYDKSDHSPRHGYTDERGHKVKVKKNLDDTYTPLNADQYESDVLPRKEG